MSGVAAGENAFHGVWLRAGRHEVVFRFVPARLMARGAISALGLGVAVPRHGLA